MKLLKILISIMLIILTVFSVSGQTTNPTIVFSDLIIDEDFFFIQYNATAYNFSIPLQENRGKSLNSNQTFLDVTVSQTTTLVEIIISRTGKTLNITSNNGTNALITRWFCLTLRYNYLVNYETNKTADITIISFSQTFGFLELTEPFLFDYYNNAYYNETVSLVKKDIVLIDPIITTEPTTVPIKIVKTPTTTMEPALTTKTTNLLLFSSFYAFLCCVICRKRS